LIDENYFPLFWHDDGGVRVALRWSTNGSITTKDGKSKFDLTELEYIAMNEPTRLSPGVMLRPVVQDYLLPSVCYFGGGAEIAYFAQNSEVYHALRRPVTPILHRQSFTFIEARQTRIMEKFGLKFEDMFEGLEAIISRVVDKHVGRETAQVFATAEGRINSELDRVDRELSQIDPTLSDNLATRRRKINYHIEALRNKFRKARLQKDATADSGLRSIFIRLLPNGGIQERTLNVTYFLNRYGPSFIDWAYDSIDLDDKTHRLVHI
jgi:uncharacterized protein YllA (UPF0747 family)